MPVTGVDPAVVLRLLTVTLRSLVPCAYAMVNVLKSTPSGWSVPVKVSVVVTGVGAVALPPQAAAVKSTIAHSAIDESRLAVRVGMARP